MKKFLLYYVVALVFIRIFLASSIADIILLQTSQLLTWISAGIISIFGTDFLYQGLTLRHDASGRSIEVAQICSALEPLLFLAAAIIVFPSTLKSKLMGIAFAIIAVQVLNIVRIVSLFYVLAIFPDQFNLVHEYVWSVAFLLDVSLCFVAWVYYDRRMVRNNLAATR